MWTLPKGHMQSFFYYVQMFHCNSQCTAELQLPQTSMHVPFGYQCNSILNTVDAFTQATQHMMSHNVYIGVLVYSTIKRGAISPSEHNQESFVRLQELYVHPMCASLDKLFTFLHILFALANLKLLNVRVAKLPKISVTCNFAPVTIS